MDDWTITPIQYKPEDLAGLKVKELDLDKLIAGYGIPASFFRDYSAFNNMSESLLRMFKVPGRRKDDGPLPEKPSDS